MSRNRLDLIDVLAIPALMGLAMSLFLVTGCSSGSSGGGGGSTVANTAPVANTSLRRHSLNGDARVDDLELNAGSTTRLVYVSDFPSDGPFVGVDVNVPDTLSLMSIDTGSPLIGGDAATADVTVRIGHGDQSKDTCFNGFVIAQLVIPMDGSDPDFDTVTAPQSTVNVINTGQYTICIDITPSVDARLTVPSVEFDVTDCLDAPQDIAGEWTGPFTCTDECGSPFGDTASIFIEQDGHNARYCDDGGGEFVGTVCGHEFHFSGGYFCDENLTCDEIEIGTFYLQLDGSGIKQSRYTYLDGKDECSGDCEDFLSRGNSLASGGYDVDFVDKDWVVEFAETGAGSEFTAGQAMEAYRETTHTSAGAGGDEDAKVFHRSLDRTWTPGIQGPIEFLDIEWDSNLISVPGGVTVSERPVVYQRQSDGSIQIFELDFDFAEFPTEGWSQVNFGAFADEFTVPGKSDESPNFIDGDTLWFGYVVDTADDTKGDTVHGIDNFSVILFLEK